MEEYPWQSTAVFEPSGNSCQDKIQSQKVTAGNDDGLLQKLSRPRNLESDSASAKLDSRRSKNCLSEDFAMPDTTNTSNQIANPEVVAITLADDGISPQRMDEIRDSITDAEWERFRGFDHVAIGRRTSNEPFAIMLGFGSGPSEELADFALALPSTASFFIVWHRNLVRAAQDIES